jgi:hypothetical protein
LANSSPKQLQEDDIRNRFLEYFKEEEPEIPESAAFLGKDVMSAIWNDMEVTRVPSWVTRVPLDWGTPRRGKLNANHWKVIFCIHIPITLIRLFGDATGRKKRILDNTMDLCRAIRIATMDRSSPNQIKQYNALIFRYSQGVRELFPDYNILPSHHAALHIGEMLERFGPKHAHDSPHYERFIKFFRRMKTNNKIGEKQCEDFFQTLISCLGDLEGTLLRTSVRCANSLALVSDQPALASHAKSMMARMDAINQERLRGFRLAEFLDPSYAHTDPELGWENHTDRLPDALYDLLCEALQAPANERNVPVSRNVCFKDAVSVNGNTYGIWESRRYRDSLVLIQGNDSQSAAILDSIFQHRHVNASGERTSKVYFAARTYLFLPEPSRIYGQYGFSAGFCCDRDQRTMQRVVVPSTMVVCHIATTDFGEGSHIHVLPINRVRPCPFLLFRS